MAVTEILNEIGAVIEEAAEEGREHLTLSEEEHLIRIAARGVKECKEEME